MYFIIENYLTYLPALTTVIWLSGIVNRRQIHYVARYETT